MYLRLLAACLPVLLACAAARAADGPTVLVVSGVEGTPEYGGEFSRAADRWQEAARKASATFIDIGRSPVPAAATGPAPPPAPPASAPAATGPAGPTDKQRLQDALAAEVKEPARPLWIVLLGHGTFDGREAKFNLRGPDVSDAELAAWLKPCTRPLAVIDCTSGSAPFLKRVSGPNRVVITATRSGYEVNYSRFGEYLAAAVADAAADLDKDGQTSLLEAFLAASHQVDAFYKREGRLATEHALLDDTGDGLGVAADWFQGVRATRAARDGAPVDGTRAHQWTLVLSGRELAMPPELRARRNDLELKVEALRARKKNLSEQDYYAQLEPLLLALARVYQDADRAPAAAP